MVPKTIDIIIPLYNTPLELFKECFKSLKEQTCYDFNVIIVNDCSTNEDLLEYYRSLKCSLFTIKKIDNISNKGLLNTRIVGINNSVSKYIQMLDSDDKLEKNAIECIITNMKKYNYPDLILFRSKTFYTRNNYYGPEKYIINKFDGYIENNKYNENGTLYDINYFDMIYFKGKVNFFIWNKCIKRKVWLEALKNVSIDENKNILHGEDEFLTFITSLYINTALGIKDILHTYVIYRDYKSFIPDSIEFKRQCNRLDTIRYLKTINKNKIKIDFMNLELNSLIDHLTNIYRVVALYYLITIRDENHINKSIEYFNNNFSDLTKKITRDEVEKIKEKENIK